MRLLILGGHGMLGHVLWRTLRGRFDTYATVRRGGTGHRPLPEADPARILTGVDALDLPTVAQAIRQVEPKVVVNCVGLVKQLPEINDPVVAITTNALFPHQLARLCAASGARLYHISTDCVFSGRRGKYRETDPPDPDDLYGRTKLLGEVERDGCVTLRTSMIGRQLTGHSGLLEWFLRSRGQRIKGYANVVFSGLTTLALSRVLADLLERQPPLTGLFHVAAEPISKLDLLRRLRAAFELDVEIEPYAEIDCDRSLDASRLQAATGLRPPAWDEMVDELRGDRTFYDDVTT
jgi:dTDP-4-dehydrorhamnose reductase